LQYRVIYRAIVSEAIFQVVSITPHEYRRQ